ncbi:MAG: hypothetical protein PHW63_03570 [Alphaproteobacteria bacterium]|nr:hypothetical protein [Alphaproteobacteria bacterium]
MFFKKVWPNILGAIKGTPRAIQPSSKEITDDYPRWKKWELLQNKSPLTANLFIEMLNLYDDLQFAVVVHSPSKQVDYALRNLQTGEALITASYDPVQKGWLQAGALVTDRENHDLVLQEILDKNLAELHGRLRIGMTGPRVQLLPHPEALVEERRKRELATLCGQYTYAPLPPWLTVCNGIISPWSDVECARREANRLTPRNLCDALVCGGAGVPRGSTLG